MSNKTEILFRGKRVDKEEWVEGDLIHGVGNKNGKMYIVSKSGVDTDKKVYQCSICDKLFILDENSCWYGSRHDLENNPKNIKIFCSKECQNTKK